MFTVNNKDIRMTPLTLMLNIVNFDIFNIEQLSHVILVLDLRTLNRKFLAGTNDITKKTLKIKYFLPLDFAITKICVAIRLCSSV